MSLGRTYTPSAGSYAYVVGNQLDRLKYINLIIHTSPREQNNENKVRTQKNTKKDQHKPIVKLMNIHIVGQK